MVNAIFQIFEGNDENIVTKGLAPGRSERNK